MKKRFYLTDNKDLPVNFLLSLPSSKTKGPKSYNPQLKQEAMIRSGLHQNNQRMVFEGFYKSITRKLG